MKKMVLWISFLIVIFLEGGFSQTPFPWPEGKKMALSLTFDDARSSNPTGAALLHEYDVQATFYVLPDRVRDNLPGWEAAVKWGHEIANHSVYHSCSGNFGWPKYALEDYTLDRMRAELNQANQEVEEMLGVKMVSYAYPCGQSWIGKGSNVQSFIPLVSDMFLTGRLWLSEAPVDPWYCDMSALTGMRMDNMEFEEILPLIQSASAKGQWLILAGHETADEGNQTSYFSMLRQLAEYAQDPENGIWIAPVGTVGQYVVEQRKLYKDSLNIPEITYANDQGQIHLKASHGRGMGSKIEYMPEWKAFGWFTGKDYVEWDVEIDQTGIYQVEMEWSVSDEEAGKSFVLEVGDEKITGIVDPSGSWETFQKKIIGRIHLKRGYQQIIFRPAKDFGEGALLDLRKIKLTPTQ